MIEIRGLKKKYGRKEVVRGLDLKVPSGTIFGFLGPNGAGKTTTMKMAVGILRPTEGDIRIGELSASDQRVRERIGFMPEAPYFYERLTGMEFMRFCGSLFAKRPSEEHNERLLTLAGIAHAKDRPITTYSKGMKQRLGFAQALVNDPDYLFLDEPLDGLDPIGRKEVKDIIRELGTPKRTIFFNSHILADVEAICDRIGILHEGKLLYEGPVREFCAGKPLEDRFVELIERQPKEKKESR